MNDVGKRMLKLFEKCDICIGNNVISKEQLTKAFATFLSATIEKEEHNVGVVLHTGSRCFDAVILVYAAVSDILFNKTKPKDLMRSLNIGDIVIYKKKRYSFRGLVKELRLDSSLDDLPICDNGKYAILEQDATRVAVPNSNWPKITPYYGKAKKLDGRGIRKESGNRKAFFNQVLNVGDSEIPNTVDTSTVIVMNREYSNELIHGINFRFGDLQLKYTELVTASYFTESEQEYPYAGNASKTDPVIKVTSKISVARKLLRKKDWNRNIGLIVLGDDLLQRGQLELPELIERKSIQYIYLCTGIDSSVGRSLIDNYPSAYVFACTKDFLLSNSLPVRRLNASTYELNTQVKNILDHEIITKELAGFILWEEYVAFKRALYKIKKSEYSSEDKDSFVIQAYALMNLFQTAIFPLSLLEKSISTGTIINVESIKKRLESMTEISKTLPEYLKESGDLIVDTLIKSYFSVFSNNNKRQELDIIFQNNVGKKICVVVPKAYYSKLLNKGTCQNSNITISTANQFDNHKLYDLIICSGNIEGKRFNIFNSRTSKYKIVLLYEFEQIVFNQKSKQAKKIEHELNKRSTIYVDEDDYSDVIEDETVIEEIEKIDNEFIEFTNNSVAQSINRYKTVEGRSGYTDIIAVAKFDTDEIAFFSKNYKAYILDEDGETVKEVKVNELAEGDNIVFTRSNSKTRDIVDNLLQEIIDKEQLPESFKESYKKSKLWKSKLIDFMNTRELSAKYIATMMINNGVHVQETTIKGWLDEDSHTVGPREVESLEQIALLVEDEEMLDNARDYFQACADVRKIRGQILKAIGRAILTKVSGKELDADSIFSTVYSQIEDLAVILKIETLSFVEDSIPTHLINRPISE